MTVTNAAFVTICAVLELFRKILKLIRFLVKRCGFWYYACPEEAIDFEEVVSGEWSISKTPHGPLVHARLGVAEENSGRLVTLVRNKAREMAHAENLDCIITDGPPGIGCPVIAALAGASTALIVTEPSLSGVHDLERVLAVCRHFEIPASICVNRCDLDEENMKKLKNTAGVKKCLL